MNGESSPFAWQTRQVPANELHRASGAVPADLTGALSGHPSVTLSCATLRAPRGDVVSIHEPHDMNRIASASVALALGLALGACGLPQLEALRLQAERQGPRAKIMAWLARTSPQASTQAIGEELGVLWRLGPELEDDAALRARLRALRTEHVPAHLHAPHAVELARQAAAEGRDIEAESLALRASRAQDPRTRARSLVLLGLLAVQRRPERAAQHLARAMRTGGPGRVGDALRGFAHLSLGALHYDAGRDAEALRSYLKVERGSGYWRQARLGLAWCQFRLRRPERSVAILNQMPGGPSADPEDALLAAMAARWLGLVKEAQVVVDAAIEGRARWDGASVTASAVLQVVADGAELDLGGLRGRVAANPAVGGLAREILAARRLSPTTSGRRQYVAQLEALLSQAVAGALATEQERTNRAYGQLEILRPQLVPRPEPSGHGNRSDEGQVE